MISIYILLAAHFTVTFRLRPRYAFVAAYQRDRRRRPNPAETMNHAANSRLRPDCYTNCYSDIDGDRNRHADCNGNTDRNSHCYTNTYTCTFDAPGRDHLH